MLKQLWTALSHAGVVGRPVSQTPHEWNVCGELRVKSGACVECGRCVGACPVTALTVTPVPEPLMVFYPGRCIGCARCVEHCAGKNLSFAAGKGFMLEPNDEFIVVQRLRKPPMFPVPPRKGTAPTESASPGSSAAPVSPASAAFSGDSAFPSAFSASDTSSVAGSASHGSPASSSSAASDASPVAVGASSGSSASSPSPVSPVGEVGS